MQLSRIPGLRQVPQTVGPVLGQSALFDSWGGQYSDSPRAISEELHRRRPDIGQSWVLSSHHVRYAPEWVTAVQPGSIRHLALGARAGYLVANNTVPGYHHKRSGTVFMQTWHGTPLKRIGFDIERYAVNPAAQYSRTLRRNAEAWDLLLAPNAFSTDILKRALAFDGPVFETGYPRNDLLSRPDREEVRRRVRGELGIEDAQTAVLYAPTFRDGMPFSQAPAVERLAAALGEDHVVLLRAHKLDAGAIPSASGQGLRNVSLYPEVGELYLAADVLVTDYSSVMFDFAITGKPILFFPYDLEEYRDSLRGFYFDFEAEAPGPLLRSTEEVIEALHDLEPISAQHEHAYRRFRERFCHLDDGGASRRAVDLLLQAAPAA